MGRNGRGYGHGRASWAREAVRRKPGVAGRGRARPGTIWRRQGNGAIVDGGLGALVDDKGPRGPGWAVRLGRRAGAGCDSGWGTGAAGGVSRWLDGLRGARARSAQIVGTSSRAVGEAPLRSRAEQTDQPERAQWAWSVTIGVIVRARLSSTLACIR
jgi:hypothetical protein